MTDQGRIDELNRENARLAAYVKRLRTSLNNLAAESAPSDWLKEAYDLLSPELERDCSTALDDLLGPVDKTLEQCEKYLRVCEAGALFAEVESTRARLRALVERKA